MPLSTDRWYGQSTALGVLGADLLDSYTAVLLVAGWDMQELMNSSKSGDHGLKRKKEMRV